MMALSKAEKADLHLRYVMMQPTRQKILRVLKASPEPLYIKQIADKISEDPRTVSFHLATLAENGFVEGEYREIERPAPHSSVRGRAAKFYRVTKKVNEVAKRLSLSLPFLE
jgi:predicted ArsR family transcriptional regulator